MNVLYVNGQMMNRHIISKVDIPKKEELKEEIQEEELTMPGQEKELEEEEYERKIEEEYTPEEYRDINAPKLDENTLNLYQEINRKISDGLSRPEIASILNISIDTITDAKNYMDNYVSGDVSNWTDPESKDVKVTYKDFNKILIELDPEMVKLKQRIVKELESMNKKELLERRREYEWYIEFQKQQMKKYKNSPPVLDSINNDIKHSNDYISLIDKNLEKKK